MPCFSRRALLSLASSEMISASMSIRMSAMAFCSKSGGNWSEILAILVLLIPDTFVPTAKNLNCCLISFV